MLLILDIQKQKLTVLDANITTLIAAVILFIFGSGPVKGFAITLRNWDYNYVIYSLFFSKTFNLYYMF